MYETSYLALYLLNITVIHILAAWHESHAARNSTYMQRKLQTWTGILINVITVNVCNNKDITETKLGTS
jgi:hypothetical protein